MIIKYNKQIQRINKNHVNCGGRYRMRITKKTDDKPRNQMMQIV